MNGGFEITGFIGCRKKKWGARRNTKKLMRWI